jgi:microcystin-dependent protein
MDEFIGTIKLFAGNFAPRGWMFCQGQTLQIAQNSALFSLIGTTYGGDGTKNFMLPDLRGRVPVGTGQGPGLNNVNLGQQVGTEKTTITSDNLPAKSLNVKISGLSVKTTGASVKIPVSSNADDLQPTSPSNGFLAEASSQIYSKTADANYSGKAIPVDLGTMSIDGTAKIDVVGKSDMPFNIMQPSLGLNYIICLEGIYPSRNYSELLNL